MWHYFGKDNFIMSDNLPLLPLGMETFEEIRNYSALYVDKTHYIPQLRKHGKVIFCARPRRFGKSLTVSTMDAFFSGKKELFNGLAVKKFVNSPDFISKPVINLDMSALKGGDNSINILESNLQSELNENAQRNNVQIRGNNSANIFLNLIREVHKISLQRVVVLIDEYDAPVLNVYKSTCYTFFFK
jgi:hypothetical protein